MDVFNCCYNNKFPLHFPQKAYKFNCITENAIEVLCLHSILKSLHKLMANNAQLKIVIAQQQGNNAFSMHKSQNVLACIYQCIMYLHLFIFMVITKCESFSQNLECASLKSMQLQLFEMDRIFSIIFHFHCGLGIKHRISVICALDFQCNSTSVSFVSNSEQLFESEKSFQLILNKK